MSGRVLWVYGDEAIAVPVGRCETARERYRAAQRMAREAVRRCQHVGALVVGQLWADGRMWLEVRAQGDVLGVEVVGKDGPLAGAVEDGMAWRDEVRLGILGLCYHYFAYEPKSAGLERGLLNLALSRALVLSAAAAGGEVVTLGRLLV